MILLSFLLPPIFGAIIGWVTNALAIKMLFRPLKAYYLWGIKVPLTPGIIPRQRETLAQNIGSMVSTQLVNAETVEARLQAPGTRESLEKSVAAALRDYGKKPLGVLFPEGPEGKEFFQNLFLRPEWEGFLTKIVDLIVDPLIFLTPGDIMGDETKDEPLPWNKVDSKDNFILHVKRWLEPLRKKNTERENSEASETIEVLEGLLDTVYTSAVKGLFTWLKTPEVKLHLEKTGKTLLNQILEKLSGIQRFLLSAGQYDKSLSENMASIVSDVSLQLREFMETPKRREEIIKALVNGGLKFLEKPPQEETFSEKEPPSVEMADRIWDLFLPLIDRWGRELWKTPVEKIVFEILGKDKQGLKELLVQKAFTWIKHQGENREKSSLLGAWRELTPLEILPITDSDIENLAAFIVDQLYLWAKDALPGILDAFNVQKVVEDRINSLDVLEVENLLLLMIKKHLVYINWIGALLGGLIGLVQVFSASLKF